jgi:glycerol-3-phosphate acyltransferase PlsY
VVLTMTLIGFVAGSLPLSLWLGRVALGVDIRDYGPDRNPGAGNVWRAGGPALGIAAAVLDIAKAAVPIAVARFVFDLSGWALLPVALAPIVGHDFSPLLRFKGGKGVAATFGAWLALGGPLAMLGLAVCFGLFYALRFPDAWTDVGGVTLFGLGLVVTGAATVLAAIAVASLGLLTWTNRAELVGAPRPQARRR